MAIYFNAHTHQLQQHLSVYNCMPYDAAMQQYFSCGIHPLFINDVAKQWHSIKQLSKHDNCVAIGECGLDAFSNVDAEVQEQVLVKHIALAQQMQLPIVIHNVKRLQQIITILKQQHITVPVLFHGVNNKWPIISTIIAQGYYVSIGKALFSTQAIIINAIKQIPLQSILLENDSTNFNIEEVYARYAQVTNMLLHDVQQQLIINAKKVFTKIKFEN
jgi:TatD DNase family protein